MDSRWSGHLTRHEYSDPDVSSDRRRSLYFDRSKDLTVDAFYIFVLGGYMEKGTADRPFEKSATITLHGDRYKTIEVPPIGSKCLAVAD